MRFLIIRTLAVFVCIIGVASCGNGGGNPAAALTETVSNNSGVFSLNYPKGWTADNSSTEIILATNQDGITMAKSGSFSSTVKTGQVIIAVQAQHVNRISAGTAQDDAVTLLNALLPPKSAQGSATFGGAKAIKLGNIDAAQSEITAPGFQGIAYAFVVKGTGQGLTSADVWFIAIAAPGELDKQRATIDAIAQSIKVL